MAGKCGVFAETDINGLQKEGTPPDELMASLFDAIVLQNLTVLTRGHTLRPHVLLLGGPNTFIRGMREAWQQNIPRMWEERKVEIPEGATPEELIKVPANAQYFAALGAVEFGKDEDDDVGRYHGVTECLEHYIDVGRCEEKAAAGGSGPERLDRRARQRSRSSTRRSSSRPRTFTPAQTVRGFVGVDGGSTSTKAVLLSEDGDVLCKVVSALEAAIRFRTRSTCSWSLRAAGRSSRARRSKSWASARPAMRRMCCKDVLQADVALVETVAHTESAMKFYDDPHVIVDVGGQDIKLIVLKDGRVKDFKLNTQCSAGNGYFLQSTAERLRRYTVEEFADIGLLGARPCRSSATAARCSCSPTSSTSSARAGRAEEILAGPGGRAAEEHLPVRGEHPEPGEAGLALRPAGRDAAQPRGSEGRSRLHPPNFRGAGREPEIIVHEHCGESGAIGAAVEALRLTRTGTAPTFIGLDAVRASPTGRRATKQTRCNFCKNNCLRTFIDVKTAAAALD